MPFRSITDPAKLRRVLDATLLIEADLELPALLRHVIDEARSMTGARYGAIGVLNDDRTALAEFLTVGLEPEDEAVIGARPTGKGVLGLLITDPEPLRLPCIGDHRESFGFPEGHPPMSSFLGVAIRARGEVYGNLYLTDKAGWSEFTADDEALVEALALAAGIAIENARLHQRVQDVAVAADRDRLARDLHDTVIQRLFALGLTLQGTAGIAGGAIAAQLTRAVEDIDDTIRQVRRSIFELTADSRDEGIRSRVLSLVRDLAPVVGFDVHVAFEGPVDAAIPDPLAEHLLATVREAVTNVGRHAQASEAAVRLRVADGRCRLEVVDNGRGFAEGETRVSGFGLGNLRRRAEKLHGTLSVECPPGGGTAITWEVPVQ